MFKKMTVYMQGDTICAIKVGYYAGETEFSTQLPLDENPLKKLTLRVF